MFSTASADEIDRKKRPVGQVVKTEASHAFNIGSNPVRVTTFFLTAISKWNIIGMLARLRLQIVGAD